MASLHDRKRLGKTSIEVSPVGFGASPLGGVFGSIDENDAVAAVGLALQSGINLFDTSPFYGLTKSETVLGKALLQVQKEIPRSDFVISTKVGRYGQTEFDFSSKRILSSIDESCQRLHVDYLDVVFCHDIEFGDMDVIVNESIPTLQKLKESGKIRAIGVSGYPLSIFDSVFNSSSIPLDAILSYCHMNLQDQSLLDMIPEWKSKHQFGMIQASPLSMGLLTENNMPSWHPAQPEIKAAAKRAAEVCKAEGVDIASIALQYALNTGTELIDTTLIGIDGTATLKKNLATLQSKPDPGILAKVLEEFEPVRNMTWPSGK